MLHFEASRFYLFKFNVCIHKYIQTKTKTKKEHKTVRPNPPPTNLKMLDRGIRWDEACDRSEGSESLRDSRIE